MATDINDIVLVYLNESPAFFARIEAIEPDIKPGWWQVKLLVLETPLQTVDWILRDAYVQGDQFTMGGTPVRIERVPTYAESRVDESDNPLAAVFNQVAPKPEREPGSKSKGRVISLADRLKKHQDDSDSDR